MHDFYNYIPETKYVLLFYNVTAILCFQYMLHVVLFPLTTVLYFGTLRSMCAVSNMAVFCSLFMSLLPVMLLRYCLSDFEMIPVVRIIIACYTTLTFSAACRYGTRNAC